MDGCQCGKLASVGTCTHMVVAAGEGVKQQQQPLLLRVGRGGHRLLGEACTHTQIDIHTPPSLHKSSRMCVHVHVAVSQRHGDVLEHRGRRRRHNWTHTRIWMDTVLNMQTGAY